MATGVTLHVEDHFNAEDAAQAAAEFVASLDNLPGEVAFLLEEISDKDQRITSLLGRINTRHAGLTKQFRSHSSSSNSGNGASSDSDFQLPIPPGQPIPIAHLTQKDQQAVTKLQAEWGKIQALQEEKIRLADRLERIVKRAKERGKAEWIKVGGKDLDQMEKDDKMGMIGLGEIGGGEVILPPSGLGSGSDVRTKKRRPNALPLPLPASHSFQSPTTIIHPPPTSSMPPPSLPSHHSTRPSLSGRGSRHARNISTSTLSDDPEADAEGEADVGENGSGDGDADDTLYCTCQQRSYGEMIGCDNDSCQYEWFHVQCVGITGPAPDTWYCPDCVRKLGLASSDGRMLAGREKKGRKKQL